MIRDGIGMVAPVVGTSELEGLSMMGAGVEEVPLTMRGNMDESSLAKVSGDARGLLSAADSLDKGSAAMKDGGDRVP